MQWLIQFGLIFFHLLHRTEATTRVQGRLLQEMVRQWIGEHWTGVAGQNPFIGVNLSFNNF